jgi:hypothetical protein
MIGWIQTIDKIADEAEVSIVMASLAIEDEGVETAETGVEEIEAVATDEASLPCQHLYLHKPVSRYQKQLQSPSVATNE